MTRSTIATVDAIAARHGDVQVLPVSYAQQRFWMLDQIDGAGAYTMPIALRLLGALDVDALRRALQLIVDRHEALRTVFGMDGDEPVQVVLPHLDVTLPVADVSALPDDDREALVRARASENANAAFDLGTGPLFRCEILRLASEEHVLFVTFHHVVADGWSIGVFFDELRTAYAALRDGGTPTLRPLPLQYADYAVWQRRVVEGANGQRQLAFWAERLRDVPGLEMQPDRARPPEQTSNGGKREHIISRDVVDGMRQLARREQATPYMAFLAAFVVLLHRYTGQADIVVGSITSGRLRAEVEPLIGLFVNTLAIRTDVGGDPTFDDVLRRVRERAMEAYANQDVPFEQVVEAVQPARDRSRSPIFQVAFQLLEGLAGELELPGVLVSRVPAAKDTTKFELTLMLHPSTDGAVRAVIEYNSDLFDSASVDRMLEHYAVLVAGIVADPACAVSRLPIMSQAERTSLLVERNATAVSVTDLRLHELVFDQCDRTPDAIAVEADDESADGTALTFGQLARHARSLADGLHSLGVSRGDAVGIALDRSCELMVALVGTLAAGAHYVPLDLDLPQERLAAMLGESRPTVILVRARDAARVREIAPDATVVPVDLAPIALADTSSTNRGSERADADDLAYTIYTSGSTGRPKGVMIPHRAVVNYLCWMRETYRVGPDDAILQKAPVGFDASVWELFLPLVSGARLVLARAGGHRDAAYLADVVRRRRVTLLQLVPSQLAMMLESGTLPSCTTLRRIVCGGEALPASLLDALTHALPHVAVTNLYGPTETTVYSTHWDLERATFDGRVRIGRPIWNTVVYVVDAALQPVPTGVPGELLIGGNGVARGYASRPDLTRERFVPLAVAGGATVYRTGDRVRWGADGMLEYLGRIDTQVKLRGHRIELGEIESTLSRDRAVGGAVAVVREDVPGEQRLVAYVTPAAGSRPDPAALRELLRSHLPDYMIPSAIMVLDALPVSPNGKLDRRALPAPAAPSSQERGVTLPRTPLEEQIAAIWRDVLGRQIVGVDDDFFALGGHSLLAMRAVARMSAAIGVSLTIGALFRARTVAALASLVTEQLAPPDDLGALLAQLETMSDADAARLLGTSGEFVA